MNLPNGEKFIFGTEPLMSWLMPTGATRAVRLRRMLLIWSAMTLPTMGLSLFDNHLTGGPFFRLGGYAGDILMWILAGVWLIWLTTLMSVQRLLDAALDHLHDSGVMKGPLELETAMESAPWLLRKLEFISRLNPKATAGWLAVMLALNFGNLLEAVRKANVVWATTPARADSWLYLLHVSDSESKIIFQPTWAGLWHLTIASALGGYLIVLIARTYLAFATVAHAVARNPTLRILPIHPDGTGGLLSIGRAALIFSFLPLTAGIFLVPLMIAVGLGEQPATKMYHLLWIAFVALGPVLFFLPLLPLRQAMIRAKQSYLVGLEQCYATDPALSVIPPSEESFATHERIGSLYEKAAAMAVWPFDSATVMKYFGTYVLAIIGSQADKLWDVIFGRI